MMWNSLADAAVTYTLSPANKSYLLYESLGYKGHFSRTNSNAENNSWPDIRVTFFRVLMWV